MSIATTVEKWFADAEQAQPNTTVQLTMYNLAHSKIAPSRIESRYEGWITQFATGLGNSRAVIYLEEDAPITMPRVSPSQRAVREAEIAYAWVTTEMHFGQQISSYLGGAHFVVQSGSAGGGPHLKPHPTTQGVEDLCDPPGTGRPAHLEHRVTGTSTDCSGSRTSASPRTLHAATANRDWPHSGPSTPTGLSSAG
jgi:hypothetical protein